MATRRTRRDERGFTIVLVAIALVGVLAVSAFAVDLGQAYASRRQMQNAADAAALAATRALDKARRASFATNLLNQAVATTASDVAQRNGAKPSMVTCTVVRWNYYLDNTQVSGACNAPATWTVDAVNGGAAGVAVTVGTTNYTFFASAIGQKAPSTSASAAATIQPLVSGSGPFIICGSASNDGYNLLTNGQFDPGKAAALGTFPIQAAQLPRCNGPAAFKGKAASAKAKFTIPGTDLGDNGNGFDANIQQIVLGASPCAAPPDTGCSLALPIADSTNGYEFHIVAIAVFAVTGDGTGNPKYFARYDSTLATATGGQGGAGVCSIGPLCVIKLVQ